MVPRPGPSRGGLAAVRSVHYGSFRAVADLGKGPVAQGARLVVFDGLLMALNGYVRDSLGPVRERRWRGYRGARDRGRLPTKSLKIVHSVRGPGVEIATGVSTKFGTVGPQRFSAGVGKRCPEGIMLEVHLT